VNRPEGSPVATRPRLSVFCPGPVLTVTIERAEGASDELHLHAGGQGIWVAHMARALGGEPRVCAPLGGEVGAVLEHLLRDGGIATRHVDIHGDSTGYVHDRRSGARVELARQRAGPLDRHELDDLLSVALVDGIEAGTAILTGTFDRSVLPASSFERLARDLRAQGVRTVVDLSGEQLDAAVVGGVDLVKISDEELARDHRTRGRGRSELVAAAHRLIESGADHVLVSCEGRPALAVSSGAVWEARPPHFTVVDHRGAGDAMTAALGVAVARGAELADSLRLAVAAGSLNVTRHGLATGPHDAIETLSKHIELVRVE
jgi:1-phosphofructokinase